MTRRPLALLLALAAGCGGGAVSPGQRTTMGPAPRVAPARFTAGGAWGYLYLRADTIIQTLPNGGTQQSAVERRIQFRWQAVPEAGGFALTLTLDSVHVVGGPGGMSRIFEDSARGATIRGHLTPDGRLSGLVASPASAVTSAFLANLSWVVPVLPATLDSAGSVDTSDVTVRFGVVDLLERTIRRSVAGDQPGVVTLVGTVSRDGVSPQLHLTGSGMRWGHATLAPAGRLLEAAGRDSVAMTAEVSAIGQSVQLLQFGGYTLTPLP